MVHVRRFAWSGAACLCLSAALVSSAAAQRNGKDWKDAADSKRPQVRLKGQPIVSVSPARVVLTAEMVGAANDFEELYCPTIGWDWCDETQSDSSSYCATYEACK